MLHHGVNEHIIWVFKMLHLITTYFLCHPFINVELNDTSKVHAYISTLPIKKEAFSEQYDKKLERCIKISYQHYYTSLKQINI